MNSDSYCVLLDPKTEALETAYVGSFPKGTERREGNHLS